MLTLYQLERCPDCIRVRERLSDQEATYTNVCVPRNKADRDQLLSVSGQLSVPTLVDGDTILSDTELILTYLEARNR